MQQGRCSNFGICTLANKHELISIPEGQPLVCPSCAMRLIEEKPVAPTPVSKKSPLAAIAVIGGLILLLAGIGIVISLVRNPPVEITTNLNAEPDDASGGTKPVPQDGFVDSDITLFYDGSDEAWMLKAAKAFNESRSAPHIHPIKRASREGYKDIVEGKASPTIWNPADTLWTEKLKYFWSKNPASNGKQNAITGSSIVLRTKLVILMKKDKADAFEKAGPKYSGKTWSLLADLATKGWTSIGGEGGALKLSQADPTQSNSGALTLAMMYAEYKSIHPGASTGDPEFVKFMRAIESSTGRVYAQTTSKAVEAFLSSEGNYDAVVCYEANAIDAIRKSQSKYKVIYPDPTIDVSSPISTLSIAKEEAPDTPSRRQIAQDFTNYLLATGTQKDALNYGFRPALSRLSSDVTEAFLDPTLANAGLIASPRTKEFSLDLNTLENLIATWNTNVK